MPRTLTTSSTATSSRRTSWSPDDFVYVVDFGIARSMGGRQTALTITGATIGTLHYMAPERFAGQDVDGRPMSTPWLACCTSA
jgi:serine/threonine protein kinase